jgi:hypothetical protein
MMAALALGSLTVCQEDTGVTGRLERAFGQA